MKFWKAKVWAPIDIVCLKWSTFLVGVVVGAWLQEWANPYRWWLLLVAVVLAIKPTLSYYRDDKPSAS